MTSATPATTAAERLAPALEVLRANSEQADRSASLPAENIQALRAAGAMRWSLPRALGGDELSSVEKVDLWSKMGAADLCTVWIFANYDSQLWDLGEPRPGAVSGGFRHSPERDAVLWHGCTGARQHG